MCEGVFPVCACCFIDSAVRPRVSSVLKDLKTNGVIWAQFTYCTICPLKMCRVCAVQPLPPPDLNASHCPQRRPVATPFSLPPAREPLIYVSVSVDLLFWTSSVVCSSWLFVPGFLRLTQSCVARPQCSLRESFVSFPAEQRPVVRTGRVSCVLHQLRAVGGSCLSPAVSAAAGTRVHELWVHVSPFLRGNTSEQDCRLTKH